MTITHEKDTGTTGKLIAYDATDDPNDRLVWIYIATTEYQAAVINWSYSLNGVIKGSGSTTELWENSLSPEYLTNVYVGPEYETFTFRMEDTGTVRLGGPTELTFNLAGYESSLVEGTVRVKVGETYKQATPYVRKDGIWQLAKPYVKTPTGWKEGT